MERDDPTREYPEVTQQSGLAKGGTTAKGSATASPPARDERWAGGGDPPLVDVSAAPRRRRGPLWLIAIAGVAIVVILGLQATNLWPSFRNPFGAQTTDRSQPPLLKSIQDLSRYVAAEGNFQVVVDTQRNRENVPDFLLNERTLFVGAGSVEAYVDFSTIGEGAIVESADGTSVEVKLPAPQLGDVDLDMDNSYVFAEERGLINRLGELVGGDPNRQQQVYRLAEDKIGAAARDSGLQARAEENTRKMLEGLLRSLGYQTVKITYTAP
jgi:Protein of unknown function (DUF4230)